MNEFSKKFKKYCNKIIDKIVQIVKLFLDTRMPLFSGNAAFFLIITSIPLSMLIFSAISLVPNVKIDDFVEYIHLLFPSLPYVDSVVNYITKLAKSLASSNIISMNIIIAFGTGSTAFYCFIIGIRKIHNITYRSSFLAMRILALLGMVIFFISIIVMIIAFLLGSMILLYVKEYLPIAYGIIDYILSFRYAVASIILMLTMLLIYTVATNYERKLRHNIIGAIISTIFWLLVSNAFSFYFSRFPLSASVYGSVSGIVVILFWLYACMNIIYLGAVINEVLIPESKVLKRKAEKVSAKKQKKELKKSKKLSKKS